MVSRPVAIDVTEENISAIVSEGGRKLDREMIENWIYENGEGFFLRDETSIFDCQLFAPLVFSQMYMYKHPKDRSLLREVEKLNPFQTEEKS